jgi:hypothetical protein
MDQATDDMVWGLINRLQGAEGSNLSPRAVARIHEIITQCQTNGYPDRGTQTEQARWLADRMFRDEDK